MQIFYWLLKIGSLLALGLCLAGGELVRAGQTSALPVVALPAELPPRTQPYEPEPELHAFLARAQRLSWSLGADLGGLGRAIQIQDLSGRVNGQDAQGQIQTPIPDSTYLTVAPFKAADEGGLAGTLPYGEPTTLVIWGKEAGLGIILHLYVDLPQVARTAYVKWEKVFLQYHYDLPPELALSNEAVAWLPLPAGPWTTLPAMYVDHDGDQQIDAVIEPVVYAMQKNIPALQQVGIPAVLPPRENPTRVPVEEYEQVFTSWRKPPGIDVSKATRVILQRRSGWIHGVDEQGRGWGPIPGLPLPYMFMGGNGHAAVRDSAEYESVEIQPTEAGEVGVVMGPHYLVSPPSGYDDVAQREAFLASDVLEIWYGPVAVTTASVLWLKIPPVPWETFPALYLDRDGDQVVDEVIEARIEIHPFQERRGRIDGVRQIL